MAMAYFQVELSVNPGSEGRAELVLPKAFTGLDY